MAAPTYTMDEIAEARERAQRRRKEQGLPAEPDLAALDPVADALNAALERDAD